jgi:predicted nucleotidyltransferase
VDMTSLKNDIDILADLSPQTSLVTLGRLERELSGVLGVPVYLVPASGLRPAVRAVAEQEAIPM